jgi:hypothetical protein
MCILGPAESSRTPKIVNFYKVLTIVLHVIFNLFLLGGFEKELSWTIIVYTNAFIGTIAYVLILYVMCSDAGIQPK